jgi:predicted metal-dependent phosphoesterase TrpH
MVSCRRDYCAASDFFRMTGVWKYLCEDSEEWKIKFFRPQAGDELRPKAAVSEFDHRVRLTVDAELWASAEKGDKLANFVLAHEAGHLQLKHNSRSATRFFQMMLGQKGQSIVPQDYFELEANFAGVCFQCGVALLDPNLSAMELAKRAFTDVAQVKMAQSMVQLEVFRREPSRTKPVYPRVVL